MLNIGVAYKLFFCELFVQYLCELHAFQKKKKLRSRQIDNILSWGQLEFTSIVVNFFFVMNLNIQKCNYVIAIKTFRGIHFI